MKYSRAALIIGLIAAAALTRLIPHPPNFTPFAAVALFAGAYLKDRRLAFVVPLAALFLTDMLLGFHLTMPFVYTGMAITVAMGLWLAHRRSAARVLAGALASSVIFFVLTNFGTWLMTGMYPRDWAGLTACYVAGIPFFQNSVGAALLYSGVLFGVMALLEKAAGRGQTTLSRGKPQVG